MNKKEFLKKLRKSLSGLSQNEIAERVEFFSEMIEDRIEEGLSEEEAIREISEQVEETKEERIRKKNWWSIVLIVLGSPIWLSLLVSFFAVVFSIWILIWAIVVSLWSVFVALVGSAVGGVIGGVFCACRGRVLTGIVLVSAALFCAGLGIFMFFGCKSVTKGIVWITKKCFVKKEVV